MNMNNNNVGKELQYDDIDDLVNLLSEDNSPGNVFFIYKSLKGFLIYSMQLRRYIKSANLTFISLFVYTKTL